MELNQHIVEYDKYCSLCKYKELKETDDPCDECLNEPVNEYTHKPVYFKEKDD